MAFSTSSIFQPEKSMAFALHADMLRTCWYISVHMWAVATRSGTSLSTRMVKDSTIGFASSGPPRDPELGP